MLSLVQLIRLNSLTLSLHSLALALKVLASAILILVDIDRLRLWRYALYDPPQLTPVCTLHSARPYPLRCGKAIDTRCVVCDEKCADRAEHRWFCAHSQCVNNNICTECAWEYLHKYKTDYDLTEEAFYEEMITSRPLMAVYREKIDEFAKEYGTGDVQRILCWGDMGFAVWALKCAWNVSIVFVLIGALWLFESVWFEFDGFAEDGDEGDAANVFVIYGTLFMALAAVCEAVMGVFWVSFLVPAMARKLEKGPPRVCCNLCLVFYVIGGCLLLFAFDEVMEEHAVVAYALVVFCVQIAMMPFMALFEAYRSNAYLWR